MSLTIEIGTTPDPRNKLNKSFTVVYTLEGTFKDECDVMNPVIDLRKSGEGTEFIDMSILCCCNYMHINEFRRYYYIDPPVSRRNSIVTVRGHIDVLKTYNSQIRKNKGLILKASKTSLYSKLLVDDKVKLYNDSKIVIKRLNGSTFTDGHFVLAVSGGGRAASAKENTFIESEDEKDE